MSVSAHILGNNEDRDTEKFYTRLRQSLKETPQVNDDQEAPSTIPTEIKQLKYRTDLPEDKLYGKISSYELEQLIAAYTSQQDTRLKYKHVICDTVDGGSYEKLLHSKHGFHSTGSTDYLVQKLGIKDANRTSFLGGLNNYDLCKGENIESLLRLDAKSFVDMYLADAYHLLLDRQTHQAAYEKIQAALNLDNTSGDALGCLAWFHSVVGNHEKALEFFKQSLEHQPHDQAKILGLFVEALHNYGQMFFHKNDFKKAATCFERALRVDKQHASSKLHLEMAEKKIRVSQSYKEKPLNPRK